MSGSDPSAATPSTSSVAGLTFSNVLPPVASTSLPSINRRSARHTSVSMRNPLVGMAPVVVIRFFISYIQRRTGGEPTT